MTRVIAIFEWALAIGTLTFALSLGQALAAVDQPLTETELAPVQVWGVKKNSTSPPSDLSGQTVEIDPSSDTSVSRALELTPSLIPKNSGGEGTTPEYLIRGQDPIQNRYFLEGIPLTDAEFNSADVGLLPIESLNRIDIFPEGSPVRLADDGLSGALDFHLDWPEEPKKALVSVAGGSFSYARLFGRAGFSRPLRGMISAVYTRSDEDFLYYNNNGTPFNPVNATLSVRSNNGFQRMGILPQIELIHSRHHTLRAFSFDNYSSSQISQVTPFGYCGLLNRWLTFSALQYQGDLGAEWNLDSHLRLRTVSDDLKNTGVAPGLMPAQSNEWNVGNRTTLSWSGWKPVQLSLVAGAGLESYSILTAGVAADNNRKTRYEFPMGFYAIMPVGLVTFRPGLLTHYYAYDLEGSTVFGSVNTDPHRHYLLASPRLGIDAKIAPNVKARGAIGQFYRAPSMYELFGTPTGVTPSQNLTYETALKMDAGLDWEHKLSHSWFRSFKASGTYFNQSDTNLITFVQNADQTQTAVNVGASLTQGQEIALEARTSWDLNLYLSGVLLWTENQSDISYLRGKELPGRPPYRLVSRLAYEKERWSVEYSFTWNGPMYWDLANLQLMEPTTEHSIAVSWQTKEMGTFILEGRNLFNSITATSLLGGVPITDNTTGYSNYPAPGRRVTLTWRYEI